MDTYEALNTGYLLIHLWLKSERPGLVAKLLYMTITTPLNRPNFTVVQSVTF
jgi:hypothetical protein